MTHRTEWSHWTNGGRFEMKVRAIGGSPYFDLYFNGFLLATYLSPATAIQDVKNGLHDAKLGFGGSACNLPNSLGAWSNL
ncbi:MAG: hypothetical protein HC869_13615 [Rhodospirillales bacterium]|nr:hypothetical protein [Rhodospirillales bacterium]